MTVDLATMSRQELSKLQRDVETALREAEVRDLKEARVAAEKAASQYGYSLNEITGEMAGPRKRRPGRFASLVKFRNPDNATETWSGRGRKPRWFNEAVANGTDPDSMLA